MNGAVARGAWERVPYREVPYAEDQLIAREMIEAGYAKVFHPGRRRLPLARLPARAVPAALLRRVPSLREVLGHVEPFGLEHVARTVYHQTRLDREFLERPAGCTGASCGAPSRERAPPRVRQAGAGSAPAPTGCPRAVRKALSLEGRASFAPLELPESPLQAGPPLPAAARPRPRDRFAFVRAGFPRRPIALEPRRGARRTSRA